MGWFKHWFGTRYYALLYGHRDEPDARAWVDTILARWDLPVGSRVLDMACGRGRHARWFTEAGMSVTGIDISEQSIAEARRMVADAQFVVHDMREPFQRESFDAACCLFTSLGYFDDKRDDQRVFDAAWHSLVPGGGFVVDFMNTARVLRELVPIEVVERDGVRFHITRSVEQDVLVKRIAVHELDGQVHQFEERVQALGHEELASMAERAGFIVEGHTDGPVPAAFDPERSSRSVLWLRKARS